MSGSNDNDCTIFRIDHATHLVKDSFKTCNGLPTQLFTDNSDIVVLDGSKLTVLDPLQRKVIVDLPLIQTVAAFDRSRRLPVADDADGIRLFELASRTVTGTVGIPGVVTEIDVPIGIRDMAPNGGSLYVVRDGAVTVLALTRWFPDTSSTSRRSGSPT